MGCNSSSSGELTKFKVNEFISGQGQRTVNIAKSLGVTDKDLNALFKAFVSFDEVRLKTGHKQQGKEKVEDFFVLNHITTKEIAHQLAISLYSTNKTGIINFEEFIITSWWIVSLNEEEVAKWVFRLFDGDNDDMLTPTEMRQLVQTVGSHNQTSMKGLEECYKHLCFEKVEHKGPMFHGQPMDDTPKTTIKEKSCKLVVRETDDDSLLAHHTLMITLNRPFHPPHQCTLPYTPSTHLMMTHSYHISHSCMLVTHQPHPYILSSPTSMQPSIYPINPLTISYPASTNFSCTRQEWTPVIAKNPNLLKPVFEMQAMLRSVLS